MKKLFFTLFFQFIILSCYCASISTLNSGDGVKRIESLESGEAYKLFYSLNLLTTSSVKLRISDGSNELLNETINSSGDFEATFITLTNNITIEFFRLDAGSALKVFEVKDLSLSKIKDSEIKHLLGSKGFELSDLFKNVRTQVSDKKYLGNVEVKEALDYHPFGMVARKEFTDEFEHGFNGMLEDNEFKGDGNSYFTTHRLYDARLGRWLSIDPLADQFAWQSPYTAFNNNPIRFIDPTGLSGEDVVAPAGHKKYKGAGAIDLFLPKGAKVQNFDKKSYTVVNTNVKTETSQDQVRAFTIGEGKDAKRYVATYNKETGKFVGYKNFSTGEYYKNPEGLEGDGSVSKSSWGETQGLYPTKDGKNVNGKYNPENWDYESSEGLLSARAAINTVSSRNSHLRNDSPNDNAVEKKLSVWHMTENMPATDNVILNDKEVKYFYLSSNPNAKHSGLNYKTHDVEMVKSYGPFYNIGGGDVTSGPTYILFYKATLKKTTKKK